MPDNDLLRIAQEYADLFNRCDPSAIDDLISEACIEPNWDDRTNLLSLLANSNEDLGLVLASEPGGDDYVVVRFSGQWSVDTTPVDWDALEDELIDPPRSRAGVQGFGDDDEF